MKESCRRMGIGFGTILSVLALVLAGCGPSEMQKTLCANNLSQLWKLQPLHAKKQDSKRVLSTSTGSAFWTSLQAAGGASIEPDVFVCPLSGKSGGKGVTSYRGPKDDVNAAGDDTVVGCCAGFHSDGSMCVLKKDGSVHVVAKGDALQKRAMDQTRP